MDANNIVACRFCPKTKIACVLGIKTFCPAGDNPLNKLIGFATYARGNFVSRNTTKRIDLFANRARYSGHCKIDSWSQLVTCQTRGMNQKPHRGARTRMRVTHAFGDRQKRFLTGERFADDAREKA